MENEMETTIMGYIRVILGIMEKKMETTIFSSSKQCEQKKTRHWRTGPCTLSCMLVSFRRKRACLRVVLQHYAPAGPVVDRRKLAIPWGTGHTVTLGFHMTASGADGRDALHSEKGN